MPRLNVSVPDDLHALVDRWRGVRNLSEICARALREELEAAEAERTAERFLEHLRPRTSAEQILAARYGLRDVRICQEVAHESDMREQLGRGAATYLNTILRDGQRLVIGGGRQMWSVVRSLTPRALRVDIAAMGIGHADPNVLHAHPNTLVTLLWLLYSPRSRAQITGWTQDEFFRSPTARNATPTVVVGSCAAFNADAPIAALLGPQVTEHLQFHGAVGDFGYRFFGPNGEIEYEVPANSSVLSTLQLKTISSEQESRVVLVAGGHEKSAVMRLALEAGICNTLVTDEATAKLL